MNISGPAAVAKPEMLFYAPGDLTVTIFELENGISYDNVTATIDIGDGKERTVNLHKYDNLSILEYIPSQYEKENGHADENTIISYLCARATEYIEKMDMTIHVISRR